MESRRGDRDPRAVREGDLLGRHAESEFLSLAEIKALAGGASGVDEQAKVLEAQGMPFRLVGRRLVVSRYHAREWLAGRHVTPTRGPKLELVR